MIATLALFDLDHTLIPIDSDHAWGEFTTRIGWTDPRDFRAANERFFEAYKRGELDIREYVRFSTESLRNRDPAEASGARERFMREVVEPAITPAATALIARHKAQGHRTIIITSTNEWITEPIAHRLGVDDLIALRLARDVRGFTGEIDGTPSFREGKVARVGEWLEAHGLLRSQVRLVFYSDSFNDLPLLEFADEPVATDPDAHLRGVAIERGWPILDLHATRAHLASGAP